MRCEAGDMAVVEKSGELAGRIVWCELLVSAREVIAIGGRAFRMPDLTEPTWLVRTVVGQMTGIVADSSLQPVRHHA